MPSNNNAAVKMKGGKLVPNKQAAPPTVTKQGGKLTPSTPTPPLVKQIPPGQGRPEDTVKTVGDPTPQNNVQVNMNSQGKGSELGPTLLVFLFVFGNMINGNFKTFVSAIGQGGSITSAHQVILIFAGELIFIFLLSTVARSSRSAGNVITVFAFAILMLWFFKNVNQLTKLISNVAGTTPANTKVPTGTVGGQPIV